MALTPLDLQTLFVKMNQVNREQAHLKGAEAQEQSFEAKKLVEQEIQKDSSVNRGADEGDMDNRIKDREEQTAEEREEKERKKKEADEKDREEKEYIKDPNLGQNIDLMG
ncbi:MAG: hypothetical protein PQJ59_09380 [Spirochaetales bacterium]|nr:hypothetical protein [Spirochaetales bacterium]